MLKVRLQSKGERARSPSTLYEVIDLAVLRKVLTFILTLFMPVIVIVLGAGIAAAGVVYDNEILTTTGIFVVAAGIGLGAAMYVGWIDW